jgi:hypothetical protein
MTLFRGIVRRHFERKAGDVVFMNLSRLTSQWEEIVSRALLKLEKDAMRRLDSLVATIQSLIASAGQEAPRIRQDLEQLQALRDRLSPRRYSTTGTSFDSTIP